MNESWRLSWVASLLTLLDLTWLDLTWLDLTWLDWRWLERSAQSWRGAAQLTLTSMLACCLEICLHFLLWHSLHCTTLHCTTLHSQTALSWSEHWAEWVNLNSAVNRTAFIRGPFIVRPLLTTQSNCLVTAAAPHVNMTTTTPPTLLCLCETARFPLSTVVWDCVSVSFHKRKKHTYRQFYIYTAVWYRWSSIWLSLLLFSIKHCVYSICVYSICVCVCLCVLVCE